MTTAHEKDLQNSCLIDVNRTHSAKVFLVGVGGLGCNIAVHLAGAGVGKLAVCDFDVLTPSNLNRQFLYTVEDIGKSKADSAAAVLSKYAPDCEIASVNCRITAENAEELIGGFDLVVLACDNVKTRLAVNKTCVRLGIPLADCGIAGACGEVYLYIPGKTPCLACFLNAGDESSDKRTLSAAAGAVAGVAAITVLRFLSGEVSAGGKLIVIDTIGNTIDELPVAKSGKCRICGGENNG